MAHQATPAAARQNSTPQEGRAIRTKATAEAGTASNTASVEVVVYCVASANEPQHFSPYSLS
jgi:hypothetical protein